MPLHYLPTVSVRSSGAFRLFRFLATGGTQINKTTYNNTKKQEEQHGMASHAVALRTLSVCSGAFRLFRFLATGGGGGGGRGGFALSRRVHIPCSGEERRKEYIKELSV
jgi:hypothetical protein